MADRGLTSQADVEALTAWMDGELDAPSAERVAGRVAPDPHWRQTPGEFRAVTAAMGALRPPRPRRDLTEPIVHAALRRRRWVRAAEIAAPLAAAAGIILAVWLAWPGESASPTQPVALEAKIAKILEDVPQAERFIVLNLSFFRHYDDVVAYRQVHPIVDVETLKALEDLERGEGRRLQIANDRDLESSM